MKRLLSAVLFGAFFALLSVPDPAFALPRSGGSFGGRGGFRSSGGGFSQGYSSGRGYNSGGGSNIIVMPGLGWGWGGGWGGYGLGGGGFGLGSLMMVGLLGFGAVMVLRAVRRGQQSSAWQPGDDYDDAPVALPGRAYVYKVQFGLGRSARGIQTRLEQFAASGDTSSEAGLAQLLQQTALELMRQKDVIRYGALEAVGPMSLTNGETKMNSLSLAERSRFGIERVRGADGTVRRSDAAAVESTDALEYLIVTLVVATRSPLADLKTLTDREELDALLGALGGVAPDALLGLEVIWTPADTDDALTSTDLLTNYPDLRSL